MPKGGTEKNKKSKLEGQEERAYDVQTIGDPVLGFEKKFPKKK